ncbi:MAG: glycosyltransferase, partial [Nocardioidaceae bacterium]
MKALIVAHGTRGDVQPYAALAHALQACGHLTVLAAPAGSVSLAAPYDIPFAPLDDTMNEKMADPELREAIETNYRGLRGKSVAFRMMRQAKVELRKVYE